MKRSTICFLVSVFVILLLSAACQPVQPPAMAESSDTAAVTPEPATEMAAVEVGVPFELIVNVNDFAPGAWTPPHSHGGPVLITVLAGEITVRDDATGEETTYRPGEAWFEATTDIFAVGNNGEEGGRVVSVFLLPEGASMTTTKEGIDSDSLPPGPERIYRSSMPATTTAE